MTEEETTSCYVTIDMHVNVRGRDLPLMLRYSIRIEEDARGDLKDFMQFATSVVEGLLDSRSEQKLILRDVETENVYYIMRDEIQSFSLFAPKEEELPDWMAQEDDDE